MSKTDSQFDNTKLLGLYTHSNSFSEVPLGALEEAKNIVLRRESLAEQRRGFVDISNRTSTGDPNFSLTGLGTGATDRVAGIFEYQDVLLVAMENGGLFFYDTDILEWRSVDDDATVPLSPDVQNGYFIEAKKPNRNFFYTSQRGIRKLDTVGRGVARQSGVPRALSGTVTLSGSPGPIPNDSAVAYRIVWGYVDLNNNTIIGAPSQRVIVSNNSGTDQGANIAFTLPVGVDEEYFYQVYRSSPSSSSSTVPDDDMQLVAENNPSTAQVAAREITIVDVLDEQLKGEALYTNPNLEGIAAANDEPPAALAIEDFRNYMFYAAAVPKASITLSLAAVGGSDGLQLGDQIEIYIGDGTSPPSSTVFTAAAAENPAANQFELFTGGLPFQNVEDTCISLVRVLNKRFSIEGDAIQAFYDRDPTSFAGRITLTGGVGNFQFRRFCVGTSRPTAFLNNDQFKASQGTVTIVTPYGTLILDDFDSVMGVPYVNVVSTIEANALYYSKFNEPEAVPLANVFSVGSASDPIVRIIASRDALYIFKREEGIFRLYGDTPDNFNIDQFDETVRIIGGRSAVNLANQIYCFSDQGVIQISGSEVIVVSRPIENTLVETAGIAQNEPFLSRIYAVGYETEREYILCLPDGPPQADEGVMSRQFVYNVFTRAWTEWEVRQDAAAVIDNRIFVGKKNNDNQNTVFLERKSYTVFDYADEEITLNITNVVQNDDNTVLTVTGTAGLFPTWKLSQDVNGVGVQANIQSIPDANTIIVDNPLVGSFQIGQAFGFEPFNVIIEWVPEDCDNMAMIKKFNKLQFLFEGATFPQGNAFFRTSISTGFFPATLRPRISTQGVPWGLFAWGQVAWGGQVAQQINQPLITRVPEQVRLGQWISVRVQFNEALTEWALGGHHLFFRPLSSRLRR